MAGEPRSPGHPLLEDRGGPPSQWAGGTGREARWPRKTLDPRSGDLGRPRRGSDGSGSASWLRELPAGPCPGGVGDRQRPVHAKDLGPPRHPRGREAALQWGIRGARGRSPRGLRASSDRELDGRTSGVDEERRPQGAAATLLTWPPPCSHRFGRCGARRLKEAGPPSAGCARTLVPAASGRAPWATAATREAGAGGWWLWSRQRPDWRGSCGPAARTRVAGRRGSSIREAQRRNWRRLEKSRAQGRRLEKSRAQDQWAQAGSSIAWVPPTTGAAGLAPDRKSQLASFGKAGQARGWPGPGGQGVVTR